MTTAAPLASIPAAQPRPARREAPAGPRPLDLDARLREMVHRHPAVGLALGIIRGGGLDAFAGHGFADIAARTSITEDTVFRVASITKLVTAVAVLQLWEQGRADLDTPASEYLRSYRLVPARPTLGPVTLRHLLTHTSGIPEIGSLTDLRNGSLLPSSARPAMPSVPFGTQLPSMAEQHRDGLRLVVEPGSAFQYSNHAFATLGQIVEDVTGRPLRDVFREEIFEPLGMTDADLARTPGIASRLATGYVLGRRGPQAVADREWLGAGAGGVYATTRDIGGFAAAMLGGGANRHGRVLEPATVATMFAPQYQPDPRIPGMGLGFFRGEVGGHRVGSHDGLLPGFNSALLVAPDDDVAVVAFTNGSPGAFGWMGSELQQLLRELLELPIAGAEDPGRDVPQRPERWPSLCGRYGARAGSDIRGRILFGGGLEVTVRGGRLVVRVLTPIPALFRGFPLEPIDPGDPDVFRVDLSSVGMAPLRIVFGAPDCLGRATSIHGELGGQPVSFDRRFRRRTRR